MHKLVKFSANPGKVYFEGLVHLLRYIRDNNTLVLKYYASMNDLLRQSIIKSENQLMDLFDSSCPDTGISTGAYIIFFQGGTIYHGTNVTGPVSQSSAEIEYNAACTAGITLSRFRMLIQEFLNKDLDIVPEKVPLIILDSKSSVCMANNSKDTKHTRHISRGVHSLKNEENKKCTRLTGVREV